MSTPGVEIAGDPSEEEVAAIVAAVEVAWPRAAAVPPVPTVPSWRFSGRWWRVAPRSWPHQTFPRRRRPV